MLEKIRIHCVECNRPVVISRIQPCFYCGRVYSEEEISRLVSEGKGEAVDVDQIFKQQGMTVPEPAAPPKSWRWVLYGVIGFFFLVFAIFCAFLFFRIKFEK